MQEKVIIIGGGVGGLTAAHELVERGFEVHVFERRQDCGGKAASTRSDREDRLKDLPQEHGFRFFPGWYRHLPDTMKRIPYLGKRAYYEGASVYDNLIPVEANLLAWTNRDPLPLPLHPPRTLSDAAAIGQLISGLGALGLTTQEVALFAKKLLAVVVMSEEERLAKLEGIAWWDYLECGEPGKSEAYRDLVRSSIRTSIAAKADQVSAYTVGRLAIRSLIDTLNTVDRVLNGPTSEVWIDPWVNHLKKRGVQFHQGEELDAIRVGRDTNNVEEVTFVPFRVSEIRRLRRSLTSVAQQCSVIAFELPPSTDVDAFTRRLKDDAFVKRIDQLKDDATAARDLVDRFREAAAPKAESEPPEAQKAQQEFAAAVKATEGVSAALQAIEQVAAFLNPIAGDVASSEGGKAVQVTRGDLSQKLESSAGIVNGVAEELVVAEAAAATDPSRDGLGRGHYYIFALPLEQMAYYVNRSPMLVTLDPALQGIIDLTGYLEWMAGVQFYLQETFDFAPGHIVGVDSEWGLTALEQTHFWRDIRLPDGVKAILSVDISVWDKQGRFVRKDAFNCDNDEIAVEVWKQLKSLLNRKRRSTVLRDEMLFGGDGLRSKGEKPNYHLDDSIVDIHDRKKQALYEKARSVKYSEMNRRTDVTPYSWGPRRLRFNVEPLLINRAGSRRFRPEARTAIRNMFIAADYVRTDTDLACMEAANEAARRAVNGILDVAGAQNERCKLWPFSVSRELSTSLFLARGPAATTAIGAARSAAGVLGRKVLRALNPEIAGRRLFPWPTDSANGE